MAMKPPRKNSITVFVGLLGWLLLSFSAASPGVLFVPGDWYAALKKPSWNPPAWVFGPVWTALYTMMAVSAWLVWKQEERAQRRALTPFLIQWVLNAAWTPLFFGWHRMGAAFGEILLLWGAILWTIAAFWRVQRVAAGLLIPYLFWVTFAAFLNYTLWKMNS